jgi:multiple sugar transport system permease protein
VKPGSRTGLIKVKQGTFRAGSRDERYIAWLFLLPNFLGFAIFTAAPVLFSLVVSCNNWNLQRTMSFLWIGFENYSELMRDQLGAVKG